MLLTYTCRISFFIIHSKYYRFWLAKITCTISQASHHNQLMLTKFERTLPYWTDVVKTAAKLQIIEPFNEKTWRRVWFVFEVSKGGTLYSLHSKLLSKNKHCKRTARRQLDRRHLLFGLYLQTWTALYLLNFPIKMHSIAKPCKSQREIGSPRLCPVGQG